METGVKPLTPTNPRQVQEVSRLDAKLLPESPVVRLGLTFLESFYYKKLAADHLVRCDLYYERSKASACWWPPAIAKLYSSIMHWAAVLNRIQA
jgi:hypothetical protein